jgi:predicted TIM-barrel fold metal-dependent hydrolase
LLNRNAPLSNLPLQNTPDILDSPMSFPIFAHHAHVFPPSINPAGTVERLLQLMDACGIEGAVCFAPFSYQCKPHQLHHNQWLANELKIRPRLRGFGTIDFLCPTPLRDQVREVRDLGLLGLKLHPNSQEFDILSPRAFEVYAAAQDLDLLCTFHTGVHAQRLEDYRVTKFDEVAHQFPNLRFTMEHMGGYHFFKDALAVLFNRYPPPWVKNTTCKLFAGLASVFTTHQNRFWHLTPEQIMEIILQTSATQCIFGLDFPYNLENETRLGIETIRALPISEAEQRMILGGNLQRELRW